MLNISELRERENIAVFKDVILTILSHKVDPILWLRGFHRMKYKQEGATSYQ